MRLVPFVLSLRRSWRPGRVFALGALLGCLGTAEAQDKPPAGKDVPKGRKPAAAGAEKDLAFKLETPPPKKLFRLQGESAFLDAARRDLRDVTKTTEVPQDAKGASPPRPPAPTAMPPQQGFFAPHVVCHLPLYFEQRRPERDAKYVPPVQPVISAGRFYADVVLLPIKAVVQLPWRLQCNTDDSSRGPDPLSPLRH